MVPCIGPWSLVCDESVTRNDPVIGDIDNRLTGARPTDRGHTEVGGHDRFHRLRLGGKLPAIGRSGCPTVAIVDTQRVAQLCVVDPTGA